MGLGAVASAFHQKRYIVGLSLEINLFQKKKKGLKGWLPITSPRPRKWELRALGLFLLFQNIKILLVTHVPNGF